MRITDMKAYPLWIAARNLLVIKVETDAGIYGLGESGLSTREQAVMGALRHYREFLVGRDPLQRGRIWQELYRSQYFEGGRVLLAAQSAIDIALHDIAGKAWGVPVYQLLGGKQRDFVPGFATVFGQTAEDMLAQVKLLLDNQWTVVRTMPLPSGMPRPAAPGVYEPRDTLANTAAALVQAREPFGSAPPLSIDYGHQMSLTAHASDCQR